MSIIDLLKGKGDVNTLSHRRKMGEEDLKSLRELLENNISGAEITITYRPELRSRFNSISLTDITRSVFKQMLKKHNIYVILVGEFSDVGMYHMHGVITSSGRDMDYIKRKITRELGRVEIRMIKYAESYINYILKDLTFGRIIYEDEIIDMGKKL